MLLYQWGCYDAEEGESFELNITRQMIDGAGEDEDIRQLRLTFKFEPSGPLRRPKDSNRWCKSPEDLDRFRAFIAASKPMKTVAGAKPVEVSLTSTLLVEGWASM